MGFRKKNETAKAADAAYDRGELIRDARSLFGVPAEAAAGALSGEGRERLTVEEARQRIQQFMNGKVS